MSDTVTPEPEKTSALWDELDSRLDLASDWLSPILVKEARQSLKSLQFLITFSLVLVASWAWSFFPLYDSYGMLAGSMRLFGYFVILAFPLLIVVPFLAFRSLAVEREDGTYELLTVTSLSPDQIVVGKLGSVLVQMATFVSAVAPCITFTYLLPGNEIGSILFVLAHLCLGGVVLSAFALLLATTTRNRYWQMVLSGLVVVGLVFVFFWSLAGVDMYFRYARYAPQYGNNPGNGELLVVTAGFEILFAVLCVQAASSRIVAGGENFATRIRVTLLLVQAYFCGVMMYFRYSFGGGGPNGMALMPAAMFWGVCGALMMGESDEIAPRAQRGLPRSFLGRLLFGWLYPGAASGYFFVLGSFLTVVALVAAMAMVIHLPGPGFFSSPVDIAVSGMYLASAMAFQLGLGRGLFLLAERIRSGLASAWPGLAEWHMGPVESLILHVLMTMTLAAFSFCFQAFGPMNPWFALEGLRYWGGGNWSILELFGVTWLFALPFVAWQVIAARGIVLAERLLPPERVVEDDQAA